MSYQRKVWMTLLIAAFAATGLFHYVHGEGAGFLEREQVEVRQSNEQIDFNTNRFTAPESTEQTELPILPIPDDYVHIAENDVLELYMASNYEGLMIRNKKNGYIWSSIPEQKVLEEESLNQEWEDRVRSPFLINYFNENAQLKRGSYLSMGGKVANAESIPNGIRVSYFMENIGVSVAVEVKIDGDALLIAIPNDSIIEDTENRLASLQVFPFLGAVRKNDIPGYMFIPDGSGALIRFQENHIRYDEPFVGKVYGVDYAIERENRISVQPEPISVPVFGMVHGHDRNAFIGIIEQGQYNANIVAYPSEVNTNFNWLAPEFTFRYAYFQPTSKNMGGFNTFQKEKNEENIQVRYLFLTDTEANYVGMAKAYRNYLQEQGVLSNHIAVREQIPIRIEMLAAETEPGLMGSKVVPMTTFRQVEEIVETISSEGIQQFTTVIRGWNNGGLNAANPDKFPVEKALGGEAGLKSLKQYFEEHGLPVYLYTDYTMSYGKNGNFNVKKDGVRRINNEILQLTHYDPFTDTDGDSLSFINPKVAGAIAEEDIDHFTRIGVDAIALDKTGYMLFSDHHPSNGLSRKEAVDEVQALASSLNANFSQTAVYQPNDYLLTYADQIFDMPMTSSQYVFVTDTVPFLQIVLHGQIDYYAPFANYDANPQEYLLRMVEYGAYPSYYLTYQPSHLLSNTPSSHLYTSYYADWLSELTDTYHKVNQALAGLQNATIEDRHVLDWGVVEVTYSNGVKVIVNYRSEAVTYYNQTIAAADFAVLGGE